MFPGIGIICMIALAIFFYKAAEYEDLHPLGWGFISLLISVILMIGLGAGLLLDLVAQVLLFIAMGVYNYLRYYRSRA